MACDFTVVVPAYNEARFLEPTLRSIRDQSYRGPVELIVVDNNSSDDTAALARRYADRVLHYAERQGAAAARQHGAEHARGACIAFIDADTQMSRNLLAQAARSLEAGAVAGRAPLRIDDSAFGARWSELATNAYHRFVDATFIPYLYATRDTFAKSGGWELDITCGEEVRLQQRFRKLGRLAWDHGAHTLTSARRYRAEGYYALWCKAMLVQFLGINLAWQPVRSARTRGA
jgi:glycosyltransferase involved in cell wall biosynthesis